MIKINLESFSKENIRLYTDKLRRYLSVMKWELSWVVVNKKLSSFVCVGLGGINMLLLGAVIGILFLTLNQLDEGLSVPLTEYTLYLDKFSHALIFTAVLLVLLAIGGLTGMLYNRMINNLSVEYEKYVISSVIDIKRSKDKKGLPCGQIMQLVSGGARLSGRSLRVILGNLLDFVKLCVFLSVCLFLEWKVTLGIVLVMMPFYLFHGVLNLRIHKNEKKLESSQGIARDRLREVVDEKSGTDQRFSVENEPKVSYALDRYKERINAAVSAQIISDLAFAWAIALGLLWFLYIFSSGGIELGAVVAYLFSLRFLLQAIRSLSVGVAIFTRHYGRVKKVYEFFKMEKNNA
ncbi:MAG: hypothetical protein ACQERP_08885 [Pseudomonadota bacterium]